MRPYLQLASFRYPPLIQCARGSAFEHGVNKTWKEAPIFYWLYTLVDRGGRRHRSDSAFSINSNDFGLANHQRGVYCPIVLVFMILLINKKKLMKEWVSSPVYNWIAWATVVIMIGLTLAYAGINIQDFLKS